MIGQAVSLAVNAVTGAYKARQERQQAKETASAKLQLAKQGTQDNIQLSRSEWEALSKQNEGSTWKDEYVTIIITSPYILLFLASILSGLSGDMKYIEAVNLGITNLKSLGIDLDFLMTAVVLAAIGIRITKR